MIVSTPDIEHFMNIDSPNASGVRWQTEGLMEPRISIVTLGVQDLQRSVTFYQDGLGLPAPHRPGPEVAFFKTRGTCLGRL